MSEAETHPRPDRDLDLRPDPRPERRPEPRPDRSFALLLTPLAAASAPSLVFCALALALRLHGAAHGPAFVFHLPPQTTWDRLFALQLSVYQWVARWNSTVTLAATGFFVATLLLPRWRNFVFLALVPYGLLLCADFTLRWF